MYAGNGIGRRRPEGWVERRRYFRRLLEKVRQESPGKTEEKSPRPSK